MTEYLSIHYDTIGRILGCGHIRSASPSTALKQFVVIAGGQFITVPFRWIEDYFSLPSGFHIVNVVADKINARCMLFSMAARHVSCRCQDRPVEIPTEQELPNFPLAAPLP